MLSESRQRSWDSLKLLPSRGIYPSGAFPQEELRQSQAEEVTQSQAGCARRQDLTPSWYLINIC